MRLKPGVLQWAAVACFCVGLIYALGLEGSAQIGQPITDVRVVNANNKSIELCGGTHARNTEYPALPEHSSRRDA